MTLTFAFCTFNRADRLENLVAAMRAQSCPMLFEILAVNNNSSDNTLDILGSLQQQHGAPLRVVTETAPGIVPARNRALSESQSSDYLVFIDDDEMPHPGLLDAAYDALVSEGADCVGGRVIINFPPQGRPKWISDDLLGFLAAIDHGDRAFWITSADTPVWTSNIAYRMAYLREHGLCFDARYNRQGTSGGGEDMVMLRRLLGLSAKIRYRPEMTVDHDVEQWRLNRRYFIRLHYLSGVRKGLHELPNYSRTLLGIPPFMLRHLLTHSLISIGLFVARKPNQIRQAMNVAHSWGIVKGYSMRNRN